MNPVSVLGHTVPVLESSVIILISFPHFPLSRYHLLGISCPSCVSCCSLLLSKASCAKSHPQPHPPGFVPSRLKLSGAAVQGKGSSPKLWVFSWPNCTICKYLRAMEKVRIKTIKLVDLGGKWKSVWELGGGRKKDLFVGKEDETNSLFFS